MTTNDAPPGLRLDDAMVDARGGAYGRGTLDFPPDPAGTFRPAGHPTIRVQVRPSGELDFTACSFYRDPMTGYLVGTPEGPVLTVRPEQSALIRGALRFADRAPLSFRTSDGAYLMSGEHVQDLSDLEGSVESFGEQDEDGGRVLVRLTATLSSRRRFGVRTYWTESLAAERVSMSFAIDLMTRVVQFGAYSSVLPREWGEEIRSDPTTLDDLRLGTALIGAIGHAYARAHTGSLVNVYTHAGGASIRPSLTLSYGLKEVRHSSGLMVLENGLPRFRFDGVRLDDVAQRIRVGHRLSIDADPYNSRGIQFTSSSPDGPGREESTTSSRLEFALDRTGLVIDWVANRALQEAMSGRVTIPWEVLISRFPAFIRHQNAIYPGGFDSTRRG